MKTRHTRSWNGSSRWSSSPASTLSSARRFFFPKPALARAIHKVVCQTWCEYSCRPRRPAADGRSRAAPPSLSSRNWTFPAATHALSAAAAGQTILILKYEEDLTQSEVLSIVEDSDGAPQSASTPWQEAEVRAEQAQTLAAGLAHSMEATVQSLQVLCVSLERVPIYPPLVALSVCARARRTICVRACVRARASARSLAPCLCFSRSRSISLSFPLASSVSASLSPTPSPPVASLPPSVSP